MSPRLYRAKRVDGGEWVKGSHAHVHDENGNPSIIPTGDNGFVSVIPETVGQYTGAMFWTNVEVYVGDILKDSVGAIFLVEWDSFAMSYIARLYFQGTPRKIEMLAAFNQDTTEVIGNIHDNPELLEEQP